MQRYFVNLKNDNVCFDPLDIYHIEKVMRMNVNDNIELVIDSKLYLGKIVSFHPTFKVEIVNEIERNTELNKYIRLLYCIPKGEKTDLVIQKATELGIDEIILVNSSRCIAKINKDNLNKKILRYNKIIKEASEQSKRLKLMKLDTVIDFKDINKYNEGLSLIAYEKEQSTSKDLKDLLENNENKIINILIGSEGGFSEEEVDYAIKNRFKSISLGRRILRSETACIYLMSLLSFYSELDYEKHI